MAVFNGKNLPNEDGLLEELSDEDFAKVENLLDTIDDVIFSDYNDYISDQWKDAAYEASKYAKINPGYPDVPYLPNGDPGYPGEGPSLEDLEDDKDLYENVYDRLFNEYIENVMTDQQVPELIKQNINEPMVRDYLEDLYKSAIPYSDEMDYYDAIVENALNSREEMSDYWD